MPANWIAALQLIPWGEVVSNAPKIVDGAKKLWSSAGRKSEAEAAATAATENSPTPEAEAITAVQARMASLENSVAVLQQEMQSSAELIRALADQNAQLIQAVALLRVRTRVLLGVCAVLAAGVAALLLGLGR